MNWTLSSLELAFVSCPRDPLLLPETLASAFAGNDGLTALKRVRVFFDAPSIGSLAFVSRYPNIRWLPQTEEQMQFARTHALRQKATYNYRRALDLSEGSRGLIVCEDDLVFRDNWLGLLLQALDEMGGKADTSILALYSASIHPAGEGRVYTKYSGGFFGTQAMFYPAGLLSVLRDEMQKQGLEGDTPYDLAINNYVRPRQNLYVTIRSLAQHVGGKSTGLAGFMHTSPSYSLPWPLGKAGT